MLLPGWELRSSNEIPKTKYLCRLMFQRFNVNSLFFHQNNMAWMDSIPFECDRFDGERWTYREITRVRWIAKICSLYVNSVIYFFFAKRVIELSWLCYFLNGKKRPTRQWPCIFSRNLKVFFFGTMSVCLWICTQIRYIFFIIEKLLSIEHWKCEQAATHGATKWMMSLNNHKYPFNKSFNGTWEQMKFD